MSDVGKIDDRLRKAENCGLAMELWEDGCNLKVHDDFSSTKTVGHLQVLLNMVEFGFSPQVALDAPRVAITPLEVANPHSAVHLEYGISSDTISGLKKLGHNIEIESGMARAGYFGRGQIIRARKRDPKADGKEGWVYSAGSDMRGDGASIAFSG